MHCFDIFTPLLLFAVSLLAAPAPLPDAILRARQAELPGSLAGAQLGQPPSSVDDAKAKLMAIYGDGKKPGNIFDVSASLVSGGLVTDSVAAITKQVLGVLTGENSHDNNNPAPPTTIFPQKGPSDAPYSVDEAALRAAIFMPKDFAAKDKAGQQPIVLLPGTGNTGFITFQGNYIKLLQADSRFNPMWVNIPGYLRNDAQTNSEYAAYAINYIGAMTGKKVGVIAWSQGNLNAQWAYKYWPSTIDVTADHIGISADYHGTVEANLISPLGIINSPSVLQQKFNSDFITTLRADGGDSAYVPTTSIYSGFLDEIVEPQQGQLASAFIQDARGVGVSNNEVQVLCKGMEADSIYTHEGTLYNPIGYALAIDALTNEGPGDFNRVGTAPCNSFLAQGLDEGDFVVTENSILVAAVALIFDPNKSFTEPPIKSYAK
ncbi:hypothetical protein KVR01_011607 [Diaporthe batatas]|uniref:uncharacterized protein n=1 Tax=Diaporthe batatas TaxID=748121 RepID=UPI001D04CE78|nr:uncharacterized protein KVR01_011607 [Diaporthe batatas]KAG8158485.1 hypothetical protein KVR01_011607 [Diaporthe batatas]